MTVSNLMANLQPHRLRIIFLSFGRWAPLIFILAYTLRPLLFLPSGAFAITAGLIFGTVLGTIYTIIGSVSGSCLAFLIARKLGRNWVEHRFGNRIERLRQVTGQSWFRLTLFLRMVPLVPFDVVNYGAGVTGMPFRDYLLATIIGVTPASFAFVYFGDSLAVADMRRIMLAASLLALVVGIPLLGRNKWKKEGS